jgi:hypothetical protein
MASRRLASLGRWPAIQQESVPCAFGGEAHLTIGQLAPAQFVLEHIGESCTLVRWDESEDIGDEAGA